MDTPGQNDHNNFTTNPYVGPRPFQTGERLFGREQEVQDLARMLSEKRIVLLFSPSGAGKTSLVRAGLIPAMQAEGFQILPIVRLSIQPPSATTDDRFNRYVFSMVGSLEITIPADQRQQMQELEQASLPDYLPRFLEWHGEADNLEPEETSFAPGRYVLIIDQFEELLTLSQTDRQKKIEFCQQLSAALDDQRLWAVFVMREEFLGPLEPFREYLPMRLSNHFRLDLLSRQAALDAIVGTASSAGMSIDAEAATALVDELSRVQEIHPDGSVAEVAGETVEPVQLQVVMRSIWEATRPDSDRITLEDVRRVGDVDQALAGYYANAVANAASSYGVDERQVREWVERQLITPDGTRLQVLRGSQASQGLDNQVIDALVAVHLVRSESRRGTVWYELAHDRLVKAVRQDNARWLLAVESSKPGSGAIKLPAPAYKMNIRLSRSSSDRYQVKLESVGSQDGGISQEDRGSGVFNPDLLRLSAREAKIHGDLLRQAVFGEASSGLSQFYEQALADAVRTDRELRLRIIIDRSVSYLQNLNWETLRDPSGDDFLALTPNHYFSRLVSGNDMQPIDLRPLAGVRALIFVANPTDLQSGFNLGNQRLAEVPVNEEVKRAEKSLKDFANSQGIPDKLFMREIRSDLSPGEARFEILINYLEEGYDILYLVCHAGLDGRSNQLVLVLENEDGTNQLIDAKFLIDALRSLETSVRPRLIVLASGGLENVPTASQLKEKATLATLGAELVEAGVPAVVAMQDNMGTDSIDQFFPAFFRELGRSGQVDTAMAFARRRIRYKPDWWVPVLYMSPRAEQLWPEGKIEQEISTIPYPRPIIPAIEEPLASSVPAEVTVESGPASAVSKPEQPSPPAATPVTVYSIQSVALHASTNVLSQKLLDIPANTPLQVADDDPEAALSRLGDPDQWLRVQMLVDGEQVQGFIEADLVSAEPVVLEGQESAPIPAELPAEKPGTGSGHKETPTTPTSVPGKQEAPGVATQAPAPPALPQAWIVVANPKQYSWEANFSKVTPDGPPVEVNWTHARGALAQAYIKRSRPGDIVLAYLSSAKKRAIIGLAEVAAEPQERDGWWSVRIRLGWRFSKDIGLAELKRRLPELEKVRVERASYSIVAPDLWPTLRNLVLAGNSGLEDSLPQTLAGAGQPALTLKLEPLNFPDVIPLIETQIVPVSQHLTGSLRVTNIGEVELAGGKDAPPVSITAEWYRLGATGEEDARSSEILSYTPSKMIASGQTTEWRKLIFKSPSQPGKYEVRLVVTDPERGLGAVSPPIFTEVLDPQAPGEIRKLFSEVDALQRELRDSGELGATAAVDIELKLARARGALAKNDIAHAQSLLEQAKTDGQSWQSERSDRQEIENDLQMLTKEANRALPPDLSIPFNTQVSALRERNNALAPLPQVQATLDNLRALYNALRDEYNRINQELAGLDPAISKDTRDAAIAAFAEIAGQPYQQETFEKAVTENERVIKNARKAPHPYALKAEALDLPASAPAGETLSFKLRLTNTGRAAWASNASVLVTEFVSRRKPRAVSGLALPPGGILPGSFAEFPLEVILPVKPGKTVLSWAVELPDHTLKTETNRATILVEARPVDVAKIPAGPTQKEGAPEEIEKGGEQTPPAGIKAPQPTDFTISGITIYNAPVEYHYGQLGELAGGEPAKQKITITITPQNIELSYNGKDYLSPSAPLLNDLELKDPFRFKPVDYGRKLFNCLISTEPFDNFHQPTRDGYTEALSESENGLLEIAIESRLTTNEGFFAWEYLTNERGEPLATLETSPLYRQVGGDSEGEYPDANPLKILFAISSPQALSGPAGQGSLGQQPAPPAPTSPPAGRLLPENPIRSAVRQLSPLDRQAEAAAIHDGMQAAVAGGLAKFDIIGGPDDATGVSWERIQRELKEKDYHVLHLLAHGIQNPLTNEFNLVMEVDGPREAQGDNPHFSLVSREAIDSSIAVKRALRLVTLASCRSADPSIYLSRESRQSTQSFAEHLIGIGIPAVIAMQDNMDIAAAQLLTRSFYEELAHLGRIDTALAAARRDLYTWQKDNRAWGIPVLLLKGGDPYLFHVDPSLPQHKNYTRSTVHEKTRDLKNYQERTERKEPAQDRALQEAERMFNAAGMGASPSLMLAMQQTLASQLPVKPEASIPLAEPQTTRALAGDYFNLLSIRASALQYYVANDHKDRLKLPDSTYAHIASSLNAGKHIILTGPPGCAKTSLAMAICDFVVQHVQKAVPGYVMTTASSDWTTFDTVGGYMPDQSNNLQFRLGIFLDAIRKGEWLIIDEINRAEIDKAFGPLFTVLSGQEVVLPYRVGAETVCVQPAVTKGLAAWDQEHRYVWIPEGVTDTDYTYVIHPNWRIIGTMNVYDKSSLFQMSLAFMRRFAFIDVEVPDDITYPTLVDRWWKEYILDPNQAEVAINPPQDISPLFKLMLWQTTPPTMPLPISTNPLMKRRAIGPAIVRDMIRYVGDRYTNLTNKANASMLSFLAEAFALYVTPQLDGLDYNGVRNIHWHFEQRLFADLLNGNVIEERQACDLILNKVKMLYPHIQNWGKPEQEDT